MSDFSNLPTSQRFIDKHVSREGRYSLGEDSQTQGHFLSIPVANAMVDYEEYYSLSVGMFEVFEQNTESALEFADACRRREHDDLLILQPGSDRGVAM